MVKAYDHEAFIGQALESALAQRTSFPFDIIVGEDHSTDGTRDIVRRYASLAPERVRLLERPARVGMVRNTMDLYAASRAEYVAWLDGDDYWTSSSKLQKQVDWLDRHPRHTMCFHEAEQEAPDGRMERWSLATPGREEYGIEDILIRPPGFTSTCVYRRVLSRFPDWFPGLPFCDWPLQVLHAEKGPAGWLPDVMAVYRQRDAAARALGYDPASGVTRAEFWAPWHAQVYEVLNRHFDFRYDRVIRTELARVSPEGQALRRFFAERSAATRWIWSRLRRRPALARALVSVAGRVAGGLRGRQ